MSDKPQMSTYRKALRVLSIVFMVCALAYLAIGVTTLVAGESLFGTSSVVAQMAAEAGSDSATLIQAVAILMIVYGVWEAIVAALGIRGAKNPRKMGLVTVIYGIEAAIVVVGIVMALFTGSFGLSQLQGIIALVAFFVCMMVRKEAREGK